MCAHHMYPAYQNIRAEISGKNGCLRLGLYAGNGNSTGLHITLNVNQARILGKYLQIAAGSVLLDDIGKEAKCFGNLEVSFGEAPDRKENVKKALPIEAA